MNRLKFLLLCTMAVPAIASAADAPLAVAGSSNSCADIQWNPVFLKEMPKAAAACREVTLKDGVKFAQFNGKVSKVGKTFVQVEGPGCCRHPNQYNRISDRCGWANHIK